MPPLLFSTLSNASIQVLGASAAAVAALGVGAIVNYMKRVSKGLARVERNTNGALTRADNINTALVADLVAKDKTIELLKEIIVELNDAERVKRLFNAANPPTKGE